MQRALTAALLLGPVCALLGVFVTARRMAFFSDTISHAALAGIALGFLWGFSDPTFPLILFSLLVAGALIWLKENTELLTDTIMALLLSGSVALGILMMSRLKNYRGELHRYLFGDILAITSQDLLLSTGLFLLIFIGLFFVLNRLTLLTAHEDLAHISGVNVRLLNYGFVVVLTLAVALSIRLLGILLVTSLMVIPSASARNVSRSLRQQILLSLLFGCLASCGGTLVAYPLELASGPAIVMTSILIFILTLVVGKLFLNRSQRAQK